MKSCKQCDEYDVCSRLNDLRRKKPRCPKAKTDKPMTNYDRLIRKTPEELAEWICQCMIDCCGCPAYDKCKKYDGDANERSKTAPGLVDWLKSPVEVDNGT